MNKLKLIFTFYKSFALISGLITLSCISILYNYGIKTFTTIFWFKIITLGLIFLYLNAYKKKELYYYRNLGISGIFLWISAMLMDMGIFIIVVILSLNVR